MFSSSAIVLGLLTTFGLFISIKICDYISRRNYEIDQFHEQLYYAADEYFKRNPNTPSDYFNEILTSKGYMKWNFWINNLEELVIEPDKVQELIEYSNKVAAEEQEEMVIEFTPEKQAEEGVCCPWCGNNDVEKFSWFELEDGKDDGSIHCKECGMFTPVGSYEKCIRMLNENI